ncbi:hypothetical protein SHELI_v1c09430 [Spiroplasma helicoides]|uniref:Uncharacterized protein n=1 Tax=Spiroplasma helicoides TaxID=216938 RepID=A0A1B3SLT5_9MOLU|nr:hypothetical protein [Spiroplasma helicoides]AOG60892.1 hypothetical protein SHELI_v1c09430 [Spiroplasma helicoides]
MALDKNNAVEITNGDFQAISNLLSEGKTVLAALELGPKVQESLKNGKMSDDFAFIELKEKKENAGTCACGKDANVLVYLWR